MEKKTKSILVGLIAIILGILVMVFPYVAGVTVSVIAGISIIVLGLWMMIAGALHASSMGAGLLWVLIGIIGVVIGILFLGNVTAVAFLLVLWVFLVGIWMIATGLFLFFEKGTHHKVAGAVSIILGIIFFGLGVMSFYDPTILAILVGLDLVIIGILMIWGAYSSPVAKQVSKVVTPQPPAKPAATPTLVYDSYRKTWFEVDPKTGEKKLAKK